MGPFTVGPIPEVRMWCGPVAGPDGEMTSLGAQVCTRTDRNQRPWALVGQVALKCGLCPRWQQR